ncbi:maleylpyruvate isomerase N-terminal domain-containing protein [Nocardia sp. BSTN01]|uniref:maleylpyruvate isomerase N-terminal domain-containing protein n=1 Tax=Nocardia sp. BSTN01 TaxID=2783665 RepID=UPI00188F680D|nr:maleylpyruvate isomerase N-terminal domain-containing protein [Nocardia sp. BSTN01]MBF5002433.1 maleylpyruvate isomerase N-terminal domain-containing protein [Nocardia sp. BSTN01]
MSSRYLPGLSDERRAVIEFCGELNEEQWAAPSAAAGWSVAEVVIHMTTGVRALLTPSAAAIVATRDVERLNEQLVDEKRSHTTRHVLPEFDTWSRRGLRALTLFTAAGIRRIQLPIGELGWYRLDLIPAMLLFDWHTHLRHDIAPALDLPPPPTDALRMNAILTWLTVLLEHSHREALSWLDAPVALTFTGPGGGTWRIEPRGGRLRVRPGRAAGAAAHIAALALEFPQWGTRRLPWRAGAVAITGDAELGARVLDSINLV